MSKANEAKVQVASGDALDVRWFSVKQAMSRLFRVDVHVVSQNPNVDFDEIIGNDASFSLGTLSTQSWRGVCIEMDQVKVDKDNLATYALAVAPRAYLMTQRKNYRIFQYVSELDIVKKLLGEWSVPFRVRADSADHKPRKFRVQYGESDFAFACRMLEDAGISFYFEDADGETTMVLDDQPQEGLLSHPDLPFFDEPGTVDKSFVTKVAVGQRTRPAKVTIGDVDYRKASANQPRLSAADGLPQESELEQFDHDPGAFLYQCHGGAGNTPHADDRGTTRTDEEAGQTKATNRLLGHRQDAKVVRFESDVLGIAPGSIATIANHPHTVVESAVGLLATGAVIEAKHNEPWRVRVQAVDAAIPFRPQLVTPRPKARGLESATVVGPSSDEIHTDEYGRVRVHFHWDRESKRDDSSSCWLPTSQPWAGAGFGGVNLPRIGQEVLVEFLADDPDRPVVIGRVFTEHQPPPYPMPQGKKLTGIIGKSSPRMIVGASEGIGQWAVDDLITKEWVDKPFQARTPEPLSPWSPDNAFVLGDAQGEDITFLRATRDMNWLIKNNWTTVVGNYRGAYIGGDDFLYVRNKQQIDVLENQQLVVNKEQTVSVGELREERVDKDLAITVQYDFKIQCEGTIAYKAKKNILVQSLDVVRLEVGKSSITVSKTSIVVDAPTVHLNPTSGGGASGSW